MKLRAHRNKNNKNKNDKYKPIVLFDVDGTMVFNSLLHVKVLELSFKKVFNKEIKIDWKKCSGKTDLWIIHDHLIEHGISHEEYESKKEELIRFMTEYYEEHIEEEEICTVYPGINETLNEIKDKVYLGLSTGNIEGIAYTKIKKAGVKYNFQFGGFGSDNWQRSQFILTAIKRCCKMYGLKFRKAKKNTFYIGDTPHDLIAAREAGVKSIIVLTGYYGKWVFEKQNLKADLFLKNFKDEESRQKFLKFIGIKE
ncbi:MAG: HAD family hydrolase [Promethearchaeota archaeon]